MKMGIRSIQVVIGIVLALTSVSCGICTIEAVKKCLAPLKEVEYDVAAAIVPYLEEDELRDHCRRYSEFETCMVDIKPSCSLTDRLVYEGIEDAYNWMCRDGFKEYLKHRECFEKTDLHEEGATCNGTLTTSLNNMKRSGKSTDYKRKRICQYVHQYLDCVETVIVSFCGADAAKWQRTMDEKSLEPLVSRIGCSLTNSYAKTHWVPITIGIMLTISIIIIIMSIVLVFMQRRKRRLTGGVIARHAMPVAPPPYDGPGPNVMYNGTAVNMAATGVQQTAGPLPQKSPAELMQPPPYYSQDLHAHVSPPPRDEGVAAGYFGATASGASVPEVDDKKAGETSSGDLSEKDTTPLPMYETLDPEGYKNPGYEDVAALGYFGTTPDTAKY